MIVHWRRANFERNNLGSMIYHVTTANEILCNYCERLRKTQFRSIWTDMFLQSNIVDSYEYINKVTPRRHLPMTFGIKIRSPLISVLSHIAVI